MNVLAWTLIAVPLVLALYAYLAYPVLLWLIGRDGSGAAPVLPAPAPFVTIVVPAYNEEAQIRGAIEALLAQDYPSERRQILVLSDASTDATDDIVREYVSVGVELLRMPSRSGKTAAENASASRIRGEIVINTDASIRLHPSAVWRLVSRMLDPGVGVASSTDVSVTASRSSGNSAEARYVGYEMWVRALETNAGGIVGASGSGYAIRAHLHTLPVREDLSRDFSAALTAHRHGFRSVSVPDAFCYVPRTAAPWREYRRKVRTISRGMETLFFNRGLLNPARHGGFALKLFSHKLCRWLVPLFVLPAVVGLLILSPTHPWSRAVLAAAVLMAALAVLGARLPDSGAVNRFFPLGVLGALAANLAVLHACWRFFVGREDHIWEPTRRAESTRAD